MAKKDKRKDKGDEEVIDLASRIGGRAQETPAPPPPPAPPPGDLRPTRLDGPLPPRRTEQRDRPVLIGGDEPPPPPLPNAADLAGARPASGAIPSPRTQPGPNETDLVITPVPTLDDWHKFELALRKVRGVWQVKSEYYRHGVLKVRVTFEGEGRLAQALRTRGVPGYRVRILGEDETTLQLSVSTDNEERRPG